MSAEQRLRELDIKLPAPPGPFGIYVEAVQAANLLFPSGMRPTEGGAKFKTSSEKTRALAAWYMASQAFRSASQSRWKSFLRWRDKRGAVMQGRAGAALVFSVMRLRSSSAAS